MKSTLKGLFLSFSLILSLGLLTACDQNAPDEAKSEYRIKNEEYVENISKDTAYKSLAFELSPFSIYYKVIEGPADGTEAQRPLQNSQVEYKYTLKLISGEVLETDEIVKSRIYLQDGNKRPDSMIRGMQLALQHMSVGETWEVVIPYQLGYGQYGVGGSTSSSIPAYSTLIFEVTLLSIPTL